MNCGRICCDVQAGYCFRYCHNRASSINGRFGGLTRDGFFLVPVPGAYFVVPVVAGPLDCSVLESAGCGSSGPLRPQPVVAKIISPAKKHAKYRRVARAIEDFQVLAQVLASAC